MPHKRWKPTAAQRDEVCLLRATGMSKVHIAAALGTTEIALSRECSRELDTVHFKKKLKQLKNLEKSADKGNVAAQKALLTIYSKGELVFDTIGRPKKFSEDEASTKAPKEKLGKKDQLNVDAKTAHKGTAWQDHLTKQ